MSFFDQLFSTRKWHLRNEETGEVLEGQFPPQGLTREVSNNWTEHTALGRSNPITMFLNKKANTLTFNGMFHGDNILEYAKVQERIEKLEEWTEPIADLGRPPVVTFWLGNAHVEQQSVIDSISGITYYEPTITGEMRQVTFTLNLRQYVEFNFNETEATDTRYHQTRERDYYEMLTYREYGNPLLGDAIRKLHPSQPNLVAGKTVKLPSIAGLRSTKIEPKSIALQTSIGRKDTAQKTLRTEMFEKRNISLVSHIVVE